MWFLTLVFKNVFKRKVRSALTCTGIAFAICAVVTMVGMAVGFEKAFSGTYEKHGVDIIVSRANSPQRLAGQLDEKLIQRLRELPGIDHIEPFLCDVTTFDESNIAIVYILGWLPEGTMMTENLRLTAGRHMLPTDKHATLLGPEVALSLGKKVGDTIEMYGTEFTVIGTFEGTNMVENTTALVSLRDLQQLLGVPQRVTFFLIRTEKQSQSQESVKDVCERINALKDDKGKTLGLTALPTQDHARSHIELQVVRGMAWSTSFIALLIGIIGVLNTLMISVAERTSEIGTLRAVGWRKRRIVRMIVSESLVLYCIGAPLGILLSLALTAVLSRMEGTSNFIPGVVGYDIMAEGCALAFVASLVGSLYPAVRAARLLPTEALHHE
jgi:putative ABC transport system permease protein